MPNVGPAGPEATVPPPAYANAGAAVDAGKSFGGLYRNTNGTVGWIEEVDPDVQAYLDLTGATARWALQSFVVGVKALGLWDNMVCWPMRLAQNKNTGDTVYSLGGLGTYNGTLVSGTRAASGINLNVNGARITTNLSLTQPLSVFAVQALTVGANNLFVYEDEAPTGDNSFTTFFYDPQFGQLTLTLFAGGSPAIFAAAGSFTNNTMFAHQVDFNGSNSAFAINGANSTSIVLGPGAAEKFMMGAKTQIRNGPSALAFCAVIEQAAAPSVYDLYKTTLGTSLGLP